MTLTTLVELINRISLWSGRVSAVLVPPLVFAMVYEVVSRYFFNAPTQWAFEVSYMMMGTIFLLGLSYALSVDQHVNVDFLHAKLPRRAIATIDAIGYAILAVMLVWLTRTLIFNAINVYNTGEGSGLSAWNPKIWPYRVVYAVGFALFALQCVAKTIQNLLIALGRDGGEARS
ncbi:MAG: TRAP transporter small permease subunit [Rhizobiaceae bacterium]|nr:TRAP transporter small permease subunit [Rhizobiaceae bacterium]MCV0407237.1 TRAP transporter small permease subunit [Rhizobiaceae bacterium]